MYSVLPLREVPASLSRRAQHANVTTAVLTAIVRLTIICFRCKDYNMRSLLVQKRRVELRENAFVEIVIWQVPHPLPGSGHGYKYRLAAVVDEVCVLRYDNETGKGDHKHLGEREVPYPFTTLDQLVEDFWADVARL